MSPAGDPHQILGVTPDVSDRELRRVYRELVKRHHPDHNGGSPESAARFALIQDAYARVMRGRQAAGASASDQAAGTGSKDPEIDQRIADLERELAATRRAQARAQAQSAAERARQTAYQQSQRRPTREELGYFETDDSFTSIIDDAGAQLREHLREGRRTDFTRRLTDLFRDDE